MERLIKIGKIAPIHSKDIKDSRLGLGMEKLDRDAFDPEKVYDRVAALGMAMAAALAKFTPTSTAPMRPGA